MNQRGKALLRRSRLCVPVVVLLLTSVCAHAQLGGPAALIIRLAPSQSILGLAHQYGLTILDGISPRNIYEVSVQNQSALYRTELLLTSDPRVLYCEEESWITSPEFQADPFHMAFEVSVNSSAYKNQPAYQQIDLGTVAKVTPSALYKIAAPVIIAVLDTGVDVANPILAGRLVTGYNAISPTTAPLDIADGQSNTVTGHGTMISGVIARTSPNSRLMPIRVMNSDGVGTLMRVLKGIYYATWNGAGVINMSFETQFHSISLEGAINEANSSGVVLIASAGNDGTSVPRYPAAYSNVIGVASVETNNTLSAYSNFGVNASIAAPGSSIRSTYLNNAYATWAGTSFATPFAAAEAAEILVRNHNWTPAQVTAKMMQTANSIDYLNPSYANMLGAGVIDMQQAIGSGH